jgi:putative ABC transport system permease protein
VKERLAALFLINSRLCFIEIFSNKLRSFISSFGIFLGVASLLILLSFVRSLNKEVTEKMREMGGLDIISIKAIDAETREESVMFQRSPGLKLEQIEKIRAELPEITMILPEVSLGRTELGTAGRRSRAEPVAVSLPHFDLFNFELASGRKFTLLDFEKSARVCIIGKRIAQRLFPDNPNPLGKHISCRGLSFKIIGTIHTEERWDRRARQMLFPFTTYSAFIGGPNAKLNEVKIKISDLNRTEAVKGAVTSRLKVLHRGVEDFEVVPNEDKIEEMRNTQRALNVLLIIIAVLSLFTGGVSIMNIMFATIGDRIREIGLRKALGARKSDLFVQFLIEAVLLCFVGGIPGMVFGSVPSLLPREILPMTPALTFPDYFFGMGFTILVGFLAGLFPALRAANMRPIEALQYA